LSSMKKFSAYFAGAAFAAGVLSAGVAAAATPVFVGSWEVDQGPDWPSQPPAYTGQEAAALLFGGVASDYVISTVDNLATDINSEAWYSIWGRGGGTMFAQNYSDTAAGGVYADNGAGFGNINNAASAYVRDNAEGPGFTNYAFRVGGAVPEPAAWALMVVGFGGAGAALRRRRTLAHA
jgi:PEP-CTERM motif